MQVVQSSSAALRLEAARRFILETPPATEILVVGATRGAADDFVRDVATARGATFGLYRFSLTQLAARLAAPLLAAEGLTPATALGDRGRRRSRGLRRRCGRGAELLRACRKLARVSARPGAHARRTRACRRVGSGARRRERGRFRPCRTARAIRRTVRRGVDGRSRGVPCGSDASGRSRRRHLRGVRARPARHACDECGRACARRRTGSACAVGAGHDSCGGHGNGGGARLPSGEWKAPRQPLLPGSIEYVGICSPTARFRPAIRWTMSSCFRRRVKAGKPWKSRGES